MTRPAWGPARVSALGVASNTQSLSNIKFSCHDVRNRTISKRSDYPEFLCAYRSYRSENQTTSIFLRRRHFFVHFGKIAFAGSASVLMF